MFKNSDGESEMILPLQDDIGAGIEIKWMNPIVGQNPLFAQCRHITAK